MKIYLFSQATGIYLGEDFADEAPLQSGVYLIPTDATTIPPPQVKPGQIPFFNMRQQCWEIRDRPGHGVR